MSWLNKNRNIVRVAILALLIVSLLGPWMFDRIFVPAEYTCSPPNIRLEGDFCGLPMSGFQFFKWFAGGFFYIIVDLVKGTFTGRSRELLVGLSILPLIPFFTTLSFIWKKETPLLRMINLIAWGLGCIIPLLILIAEWSVQTVRLWGLWLYILVAIGAVIIEILMLKDNPSAAG